mgnify:CR=1 FL=1
MNRIEHIKALLEAGKAGISIDFFGEQVRILQIGMFNDVIPGHVRFEFELEGGNILKFKEYNWE